MKIRVDELIKTIASALDMVEIELLGASTNHGKRIAALCTAMGRYLEWDETSLFSLASCALLHDNALTEYILSEQNEQHNANMRLHCLYGQRNIENFPFGADVSDFILYHHERIDGSGPFGKKEGEYSLGAELIAITDRVDVEYHLQHVSLDALPALLENIKGEAGTYFSRQAVESLLYVLDTDMLLSLRDERIDATAEQVIPAFEVDVEDAFIFQIAKVIAGIIDYKSRFTRKHTVQIANRAWLMSGYYRYPSSLRAQIYLAAALHDIGKLNIPLSILEKPGRLDVQEFEIIKSHVQTTYDLLSGISGFENICSWASDHHEKLDGSGYPAGKSAEQLDFISRMMACIDIYQAVSEERPYHASRSHDETMPVLYDMAAQDVIDLDIVKDIDKIMAAYSNQDVPSPELQP